MVFVAVSTGAGLVSAEGLGKRSLLWTGWGK